MLRSTRPLPGRRRRTAWWLLAAVAIAAEVAAVEFGAKGGPEPANIDAIADVLREDPYVLELLISFGTSKRGSAGHLALAFRDATPGDDLVYTANFYADRAPEHAKGFYTDDLMIRVPKKEYLFKTTSSLGETASFGLDFGEIYKRSVIGVRVYGVPPGEKAALAAYLERINDDYRRRARDTEYHDDEIKYDYFRLNCAKTIGAAFRFGAGYRDLDVRSAKLLARRKVVAALNANVPTDIAMKLLEAWNTRGYRVDVVVYRKYRGSPYVDPHDEQKIAFKDLPDRFPSVLSRDFRREAGEYEDYDNLLAMYLLDNLRKYAVRVNDASKLLEIGSRKHPLPYPEAVALAEQHAESDSESYRQRGPFRPKGTRIGDLPPD